jgi:FixJ family two-component response regulator
MTTVDCLQSPSLCDCFKRTTRLGDGACAGPVAEPVIHIVGKDAGFRRTLAMRLRAAGYCAQGFPSVVAFVRVAAGRQRGCLIVDHHPPSGIDGLSLLERLPAVGVTIPAIVIGNAHDDLLCRRTAALGVVATLRKPEAADQIVDAVARATMQTAA